VEGVLDRFMDDEELYDSCLREFVDTNDMDTLKNSLNTGEFDAAFESAHAFKGVSGNLGLTPLFDSACVLVESLRNKSYDNVNKEYEDVERKMQEFIEVYKSV